MLFKTKIVFVFSITLILPLSRQIYAQSTPLGDLMEHPTPAYPIQLYRQAVKTESHLFNGPEYVDYRRQNRQGHQFFQEDKAVLGTVFYDGARYDGVPLLYDLVKDEVVLLKNGILKQSLISEKLSSFTLNGHSFVRFYNADSTGGVNLPTGFYDVLLDQEVKLLVKRGKRMREERTKIESNLPLEIYLPDNRFYIQKDQRFYQVKRRQSVYQLLNDKKKELKKFARLHQLQFKNQREESLLAIVRYYNTL